MTSYSLYAAACNGFKTSNLIEYLRRLSKYEILDGIIEFVTNSTVPYGKVKLVLKDNSFFVKFQYLQEPIVIQKLLRDPVIRNILRRRRVESSEPTEDVPDDITNFYVSLDEDEEAVLIEVNQEKIESIQKRCKQPHIAQNLPWELLWKL